MADIIYPSETHRLCFALKDAGYQTEAATDPEKWNAGLTDDQYAKGYLWAEHPTLGWYPNPGRRALAEEIEKKTGEAVDYKSMSHEGLMQMWLDAK
jgi:hypothetical protein